MGYKTCMSIAVTFFFLADVDGKSLNYQRTALQAGLRACRVG